MPEPNRATGCCTIAATRSPSVEPCQISEGTFHNWRSLRIGPSFIKIGKVPLYPVEELGGWDRSNLVVCRRSRTFQMNESAIAKAEAPSF